MYAIIFHVLIVAGLTVRVLLRDDLVPSSRLAWFMVIIILPVGGAVVYFLFGEANLGRSASKRRTIIDSVLSDSPAVLGSASVLHESIDPVYQPAFKYAASINGFQAKTGNRAELMSDGLEARRRLVSDIDAARVSVNVLYYIWLEDMLFASDWMVTRKGNLQDFALSPETYSSGFPASIIGDGPTERARATA